MSCNVMVDDIVDVETHDVTLNDSMTDSYYYDGDLDKLTLPWLSEPSFVPTVVLYSLTFVIGIVGNSFVIFAFVGDRKNRNVTTTYLVSLAAADIMFLAVCGPYETTRYFLGHWTVGRALCKLFGFVEMLSAVTTITNLIAISVERYIAIVLPIRARLLCTHGRTAKVLIFVWMLAVAASSPMFFVMNIECTNFHNNVSSVTVVVCSELGLSDERRLGYSIYQFFAMFAAPTAIMSFCYARVIYTLWVSSKTLSAMTSTNDERPNQRYSEVDMPQLAKNRRFKRFAVKTRRDEDIRAARKQAIKMLITIIVVFLLCWGPKLILKLLLRMRLEFLYESHISHTAKIVFDCLPYVQSSANPIIYSFMSRKFRQSIRTACQIFKPKLRRGRLRLTVLRLTDAESDTSHGPNGLVNTTYTSQSPCRYITNDIYNESSL